MHFYIEIMSDIAKLVHISDDTYTVKSILDGEEYPLPIKDFGMYKVREIEDESELGLLILKCHENPPSKAWRLRRTIEISVDTGEFTAAKFAAQEAIALERAGKLGKGEYKIVSGAMKGGRLDKVLAHSKAEDARRQEEKRKRANDCW
jgi:hypothetical protein